MGIRIDVQYLKLRFTDDIVLFNGKHTVIEELHRV